MNAAAHEFRRGVEEVAAGTPYVVRDADAGFDVTLDIVDARWFGILNRAGLQKVWAFDEQGRFGVQADYRFSSEEGRDLISGVAAQLGLEVRRGGAEKIGLVVGIIGAAGALVTGVVLVVAALMGKF